MLTKKVLIVVWRIKREKKKEEDKKSF
jgi:hypothetical protein